MMPSADGRFMFYATSSFLSPSLAEGSASIHRLDLRTGADSVVQDLQLGADDTLAGLASSGDDVAWIVNTAPGGENAKGRATLYLREGGAPARSIGGDGKTFATPVMTERLVGWTDAGESGDEWIFDRDSRKVTLLARAPGLASVLAAGAHLCWRDRDRWRSATLPSR
jgi:hypothetical protein